MIVVSISCEDGGLYDQMNFFDFCLILCYINQFNINKYLNVIIDGAVHNLTCLMFVNVHFAALK